MGNGAVFLQRQLCHKWSSSSFDNIIKNNGQNSWIVQPFFLCESGSGKSLEE